MTSQSILPEVRGSIPHLSRTQQSGSSASMGPDNGHLLEALGRITCIAWKKQQKEEIKKKKGSTYQGQTKHDTHVIGPGWNLDISWQDIVLKEKSGQSKDFEEGK